MRKELFFSALMFLALLLSAFLTTIPQMNLWVKTYGTGYNEVASGVGILSKSGVVVVGYGYSSRVKYEPLVRYTKIIVMELSPTGEIRWTKMYGSGYDNVATDVEITNDGSLIIAGEGGSFGYPLKGMLIKLSPRGRVLWSRIYGSGHGTGISAIALSEDEVVAVGWIGTGSIYGSHVMVMKTSEDGKLRWAKVYKVTNKGHATGVSMDADGNIVVAGEGEDGWIMKLNPSGTPIWVMDLGKEVNITSLLVTPSGNIVALGTFGNSALILELTGDGELMWARSYTIGNSTEARALTLVGNDILVTGKANVSKSFKLWVMKTDRRGMVEWSEVCSGRYGGDWGTALTSEPGYAVVAGVTLDLGRGYGDILVARISQEGIKCRICRRVIPLVDVPNVKTDRKEISYRSVKLKVERVEPKVFRWNAQNSTVCSQ